MSLPLVLVLPLFPNDNALAARDVKEGGGGSGGESLLGVIEWYMLAVWDLRTGANSSSSRSCSTEDGKVEVELCRAEADELS